MDLLLLQALPLRLRRPLPPRRPIPRHGMFLEATRCSSASRSLISTDQPIGSPRIIAACSLCHYPNGKGRPENAGVAGLPISYFIQTMHDFRDGLRKSADPRKANTNRMISFAKNMTEDEIKAAAEYFATMKWTPWMTKVVETDMVPKRCGTTIPASSFTRRQAV